MLHSFNIHTMAKINNQAVIQKLIDELRLYPGTDVIPTELAEKILPVFQINTQEVSLKTLKSDVVRGQVLNGAGDATIFVVPSTGKFFLTNVSLTVKSGTALTTGANRAFVSATIDGSAQEILGVVCKVIAAGIEESGGEMSFNLQNPILVDAGTNIIITNDDGGMGTMATIVGYTETI